jgi:hypothetical protein
MLKRKTPDMIELLPRRIFLDSCTAQVDRSRRIHLRSRNLRNARKHGDSGNGPVYALNLFNGPLCAKKTLVQRKHADVSSTDQGGGKPPSQP